MIVSAYTAARGTAPDGQEERLVGGGFVDGRTYLTIGLADTDDWRAVYLPPPELRRFLTDVLALLDKLEQQNETADIG